MRTFRFQGPQTGNHHDNYIAFEYADGPPTTTLVLNKRNKPLPGHPDPRYKDKIDLTANKKLCAFLEAYEPFAKQLQAHTTEPYLLCSRTGQPMSASCLSSRCHNVWKHRLQPKRARGLLVHGTRKTKPLYGQHQVWATSKAQAGAGWLDVSKSQRSSAASASRWRSR